MTQIIAFDLDGTLAESKSEMTDEMAYKLSLLSMKYKIVPTHVSAVQMKN